MNEEIKEKNVPDPVDEFLEGRRNRKPAVQPLNYDRGCTGGTGAMDTIEYRDDYYEIFSKSIPIPPLKRRLLSFTWPRRIVVK